MERQAPGLCHPEWWRKKWENHLTVVKSESGPCPDTSGSSTSTRISTEIEPPNVSVWPQDLSPSVDKVQQHHKEEQVTKWLKKKGWKNSVCVKSRKRRRKNTTTLTQRCGQRCIARQTGNHFVHQVSTVQELLMWIQMSSFMKTSPPHSKALKPRPELLRFPLHPWDQTWGPQVAYAETPGLLPAAPDVWGLTSQLTAVLWWHRRHTSSSLEPGACAVWWSRCCCCPGRSHHSCSSADAARRTAASGRNLRRQEPASVVERVSTFLLSNTLECPFLSRL